jgi:hypothetical protein
MRTSGYDVVAHPGPIDHEASSRRASARLRPEGKISDRPTVSLRAGAFAEDEDGGTRFTTATVRQQVVSVGVSGAHFSTRAPRDLC